MRSTTRQTNIEPWAKKIDENEMKVIPAPLEIDELEKMLIEYGIAA